MNEKGIRSTFSGSITAVIAVFCFLYFAPSQEAQADDWQCPSGYTLVDGMCETTVPATPGAVDYTCPSGYDLNADPQYCQHLMPPDPHCDSPYEWTGEWCAYTVPEPCPSGSEPFWGVCLFVEEPQPTCTGEYFLFNNEVCVHLVASTEEVSYTCPSGYTLEGQYCTITTYPDPAPQQLIGFDPEYAAYWPVSSSSNDLYIIRDGTDGHYEGVTDFILVEQPDGSYTLNANPTSGQISQFDLNSAANVAYELADINLDGAIDMMLLNTSGTAVGIVYADTASQSPPSDYKHIDEEFTEFFAQLVGPLEDPDYYEDVAYENNWLSWTLIGSPTTGVWDAERLQKSGQTFQGSPLFDDISDASDPTVTPEWSSDAFCTFDGGVWRIGGVFQSSTYEIDYSYFNQDALEVMEPVQNYLSAETSTGPLAPIVGQILEDILGTSHDVDSEPAIFNLIKLMGQVVFGFGVEQELDDPLFLARVELLYTPVVSPVLPFRHAYLQVTYPNGNKHMTRAGPQKPPAFMPFGYIEAENFVNPESEDDFLDYGKPIYFRQLVGFTSLSESVVLSSMTATSSNMNSSACNVPYLLITNNSNSYAFQSVPIITALPRPRAQVWAPGSSAVIPCP